MSRAEIVEGPDGRDWIACTKCGTSGEVYRPGRSFYLNGPDEPLEQCPRCNGVGATRPAKPSEVAA